MRKRLLNADDDEDDDENKPLRTRDMNVIQLNPKVKTIVGIIFVVSVLIFLMYLPIFSSTTVDFEIPNVDHVVNLTSHYLQHILHIDFSFSQTLTLTCGTIYFRIF
jgi:hypothetical protein